MKRLLPEEEMGSEKFKTLILYKNYKRKNERSKALLREWQLVMIEAGVPSILLQLINIQNNTNMANKALNLLNYIMYNSNQFI